MHKHGANELYTVRSCCAAGKLRVHAVHSVGASVPWAVWPVLVVWGEVSHSSFLKVSAEICSWRFLEHEGGSADGVTSLSSHCLCRLSREILFRSGLWEVLVDVASHVWARAFSFPPFWSLNASLLVLIGVCETMTGTKSAYKSWILQFFPCFGGHITSPKAFLAAS